jgi:hypothetical protein
VIFGFVNLIIQLGASHLFHMVRGLTWNYLVLDNFLGSGNKRDYAALGAT